MDVGCGTGRVTEALLALVPEGRVLGIDASADMVVLARRRLGDRAQVWCQDALDLDLDEPVDAIVSTATLHWVTDHDRLWGRLARALQAGRCARDPVRGRGQHRRRPRGDRRGRARDRLLSSSAGRRGSSRDRRRRSAACGRPVSATPAAGSSRALRILRTWTRSCARRSSRLTSRACPRSGASRSPQRSWRGCACRWTTSASMPPRSAGRLEGP